MRLIFITFGSIIRFMYICICNAITERQVVDAVAQGATTLQDLQANPGVATCCGCCAGTAQEYLPEASGLKLLPVEHRRPVFMSINTKQGVNDNEERPYRHSASEQSA